MTAPEEHFIETEQILRQIDSTIIAEWMINEGYYPEQYVVPPCFMVTNASLKQTPFYTLESKKTKPIPVDLEKISFPKSKYIERTFGIYDFKIYHDLVFHIKNDWNLVIDHLFSKENKIYPYSFPIPITSKKIGTLGNLRSGRMIYEFIEMAENDLLKESYNFKYILKTDIKNFYQSIYTHSIAWALHTKEHIRNGNRENYQLLGNKIDILARCGNDGCTNGIPIGPAMSDLISEIILAASDKDASLILQNENIKFIGVRYKDDYRFLCNSEDDAHKIIKILQRSLSIYNLTLNENKSHINVLPEGLFRTWKILYQQFSMEKDKLILYKKFEHTLLNVLEIDKTHPGTGIIDKFLSELTNSNNKLKLIISENNICKVISMLIHLKERRAKSFPQIIALIELIYNDPKSTRNVKRIIINSIKEQFDELCQKADMNHYEILWLSYFIISNNLFDLNLPDTSSSKLLLSIRNDQQKLFSYNDFNVYKKIQPYSQNNSLLRHLEIFNRTKKHSNLT